MTIESIIGSAVRRPGKRRGPGATSKNEPDTWSRSGITGGANRRVSIITLRIFSIGVEHEFSLLASNLPHSDFAGR
jgi:hypothetical protein